MRAQLHFNSTQPLLVITHIPKAITNSICFPVAIIKQFKADTKRTERLSHSACRQNRTRRSNKYAHHPLARLLQDARTCTTFELRIQHVDFRIYRILYVCVCSRITPLLVLAVTMSDVAATCDTMPLHLPYSGVACDCGAEWNMGESSHMYLHAQQRRNAEIIFYLCLVSEHREYDAHNRTVYGEIEPHSRKSMCGFVCFNVFLCASSSSSSNATE